MEIFQDGAFPNLEYYFFFSSDLVCFSINDGAFPNLEYP